MGIFDDDKDPEEATVDDIVDEFRNVYDEIEQTDPGESIDPDDLFDEDDLFSRAEQRASRTAKDHAVDALDHLIHDDCDSEECQRRREILGIGRDDETDTENEDGADDVQEGDGGSGNGDDTPNSDEPDDDGGSGGGGGSVDDEWDEDTNIFGEPV